MKHKDLLKIAEHIRAEVSLFLPYSSNNISLTDQPFHRVFWITAMRARSDEEGIRERIRQWKMNLKADNVDTQFKSLKVTAKIPNNPSETPTLEEWHKYISTLPKRALKIQHKDGTPIEPNHRTEARAKNAIKFGIGNCGEKAAVAFSLLLEYPKEGLKKLMPLSRSIPMEIVSLSGSDHTFLVLDRDPKSDLQDMSTWGPNAIILDPWMDSVVSVTEELQKSENKRSGCFKYISKYQGELVLENKGNIGQGHTQRWDEHRKKKMNLLC